jgi:hypothetical protein
LNGIAKLAEEAQDQLVRQCQHGPGLHLQPVGPRVPQPFGPLQPSERLLQLCEI